MNLSNDDLLILFYLQKYSFLTIEQTTRALANQRSYQSLARRLSAIEQTTDFVSDNQVPENKIVPDGAFKWTWEQKE